MQARRIRSIFPGGYNVWSKLVRHVLYTYSILKVSLGEQGVMNADIFVSAPSARGEQPSQDDERPDALRRSSQSRDDAAREEADRLLAEKNSIAAELDRTTRLLNTLRDEYDKLRSESSEKEGQGSAALSETVRLRSRVVEVERELEAVTAREEDMTRSYIAEKKQREALERLCVTLRSKVAVAEGKAQDEKTVQEAVTAREAAEAQVIEAKMEAERWRARSSAVDITRERAEDAERSERLQREKTVALQRELESRELLIRQLLQEKKTLTGYMRNYENELEEKETELARVRSVIKKRWVGNDREDRNHREERDENVFDSEDETDVRTSTSLATERDLSRHQDVQVCLCLSFYIDDSCFLS